MRLLAILGAALLVIPAQAEKADVHVECTCEDSAGSQVATALRDLIAASPRYNSVNENRGGWRMVLVSAAVTASDSASAIGYRILRGNIVFHSSGVRVCGKDSVDWCARSLYSSLDEEASSF
jgi:hypothetical protein